MGTAISSILFLKFPENQNLPKYCILNKNNLSGCHFESRVLGIEKSLFLDFSTPSPDFSGDFGRNDNSY